MTPYCPNDNQKQMPALSRQVGEGINTCPVCGENISEWKYGFKQCDFCGLVYFSDKGDLSPAPGRYKPDEEKIYWSSRKKLFSMFLDILENPRTSPFIKSGKKRILDIGCAYGDFIRMAVARGWEAEGIEISPEMVRRCRAGGLSVYDKVIEDLNLPADSYDAVTMIDVLCLVPQPLLSMREVYRVLKPGGMVVIRECNFVFESLSVRLQNTVFLRLLNAKPGILHNWNFTSKSLRILLKKAGFENIEIINSRPSTGDPYATGGKFGSGFVSVFKTLYYLFSMMVYFVSFRRFMIASSLIAIAKKP